MNIDELEKLIVPALDIAKAAGAEILDVYQNEIEVDDKADGSPLTMADRRAHEVIVARLEALTPDIPVLSEESAKIDYANRKDWQQFWLVDPLDGTKEFVKRNGEFTVNIALIDMQVDSGVPVLGVVYTPVQDIFHYGARGIGAFKKTGDAPAETIKVRQCEEKKVTVVASRSHAGSQVEQFRNRLGDMGAEVESRSMGSSLKICLVAEGTADIYPRLGLTSEWDTAAAHAVLEAAGGRMTKTNGEPLAYNKQDILNPFFLAYGKGGYDWKTLVEEAA